jgi:probable HAF family extracellular repeat protein
MGTVALQGDSALRNSYAMGIAFLPDLLEYRVVGKSQNSAGLYRAFMVPYATALDESDDLGTLAGTGSSEAADVNDLSEFAGSSTVPGGQYHAVYHSPTTLPNLGFVDLGTLPGGAYSNGKGINNSGHIVGTSTTPTGGRAVLWFNNGTKKNLGLNEPGVPGNVGNLAGWTLITAEEISNSGHIVGFGSYNGATRAFLLTPSQLNY